MFIKWLLIKLYFILMHWCRYLNEPLSYRWGNQGTRRWGEPSQCDSLSDLGILSDSATYVESRKHPRTRWWSCQKAGEQSLQMVSWGGFQLTHSSLMAASSACPTAALALGQGFSHQTSAGRVGVLKSQLSWPHFSRIVDVPLCDKHPRTGLWRAWKSS